MGDTGDKKLRPGRDETLIYVSLGLLATIFSFYWLFTGRWALAIVFLPISIVSLIGLVRFYFSTARHRPW